MKLRPIPFTDPLVVRILLGQKTETRRPVRLDGQSTKVCPYGDAGDRLYVRHRWAAGPGYDDVKPRDLPPDLARIWTVMTGYKGAGRLRPPMFMPKWASRIHLAVEHVRLENLQDISEEAVAAEGIEGGRAAFSRTWDAIYQRHVWASNPLVWVVQFSLLQPGLGWAQDHMPQANA